MPQFILFRTLKNSCYFEIGKGRKILFSRVMETVFEATLLHAVRTETER